MLWENPNYLHGELHGEQGPVHMNEDFSDFPDQAGHQLNTAKCVTLLIAYGTEEPTSWAQAICRILRSMKSLLFNLFSLGMFYYPTMDSQMDVYFKNKGKTSSLP